MMAAEITYEQLSALNAAYGASIDDDRLESWPEFFADDCLYKITTADNQRQGLEAGMVYADSKGMLHDRVTALREANVYERQWYRHITGTPLIVGRGDDGVTAETPFLVVRVMRNGQSDLFATGRYLDRVVAGAEGKLKFAQRIVVCDSNTIDTLLAIPL